MTLSSNESEVREILCPNCRKDFLGKIVTTLGEVVRLSCTNCKYALRHESKVTDSAW